MESEARVVAQAQKGSKEAFREILRLHQGRIRAYLSRFVHDREIVEDLAQETFLAAYRSLPDYNREAPFGLWLLRIAKHRALTHLRNEAVRLSHERDGLASILTEAQVKRLEQGEDELSRHEDAVAALRNCIEQLPSHGTTLVRSHYFEKQSLVEISRETGRGKSALGVALLRFRQALRQCMESKLAGMGAGS